MEKILRFAPLIRVSTEAQAKKGESLNTQRKQLESSIKSMNGTVYKWYAGQEHATPDQERQILEELLNDATQKKFDAVIVTDTSRWSRDSKKNSESLDILRQNGVRFFTGMQEFDLYNHFHELILTMGVAMNQFHARELADKSTDNRIGRAEQGFPSCGKKPWGRIFCKKDKDSGIWAVDEDKKKMIQEIARLYLEENRSFDDLQKMFKMNGSNIHKILTKRSGDQWIQRFKKRSKEIVEVVTEVPRLLPEETIQAIRSKCEARRTWEHGPSKYNYLFSRIIFDKDTGYALTGTPNARGQRYYRTYKESHNRYMLNADILESAFVDTFFEALASNDILYDAVFEGSPDLNKTDDLRNQITAHKKELNKIEKQISNISQAIMTFDGEDMTFLLTQQRSVLKDLERQLSNVKFKIDTATRQLQLTLTKEEVEANRELMNQSLAQYIERSCFQSTSTFEDLSYEDRVKIVKMVFGGKDETGKRYGIYIRSHGGKPKTYSFEAYGRLGNIYGYLKSGINQECELEDLRGSIATNRKESLIRNIAEMANCFDLRRQYPHLTKDKTTYTSY